MAIDDLDEDLDLGIESEGGGKKKLFIIVGALVLLLAIGGGAAWFFMSGDQTPAVEGEVAEEEAVEEVEQDDKGPAIYLALNPKFVVNLPPGGSARMLQIGVQVMARNQDTVDFLSDNEPMVRHHLITLFGNQKADGLRDSKGKAKLQKAISKTLNKIVKDERGPGEIEAVFFTSFVMQ